MTIRYTCKTCRNYDSTKNECHRLPPIRLPRKFSAEATAESRLRDEELIWGWPKVQDDDWCRKYQRELT